METKYSVLMSVYRNEEGRYLHDALDSMAQQTIAPSEIVLVEDGPLTEDLYQTIKAFEEEHPGLLNTVINDKNLGLGLALQKGILACSSEMIARMDSDDVSRKDRCEKQLLEFDKDPALSLCGGWIREFPEDNMDETTGIREVPENDAEIREYLKHRCPFNHMTVMFKKSEVLRAGNYQDYLYNEDYLLWIHMTLAGCRFHNLQEVLVDVRTSRDMYANRRGGDAYYQSEKGIQKKLLENHLITRSVYNRNVAERFVLQKMMTPGMRSFVFRHFARSGGNQ